MSKFRLTAAERSEQLVSAAIKAFSNTGYAGTSTDEVARLADVSQPYVIRLFGSKQQLFIAGIEHAADRIEQTFRDAGSELISLGAAYDQMLVDRELLVMLLHGYAASSDPEIGAVVRERFGRIYRLVKELTGAQPEEVRTFLSTGMLLTVLAALQVVGRDAVPPEPWVNELIGSLPNFNNPTP